MANSGERIHPGSVRIYGIDFLKFMAAYDSAASRGRSTPPARLIRKDKGIRRR